MGPTGTAPPSSQLFPPTRGAELHTFDLLSSIFMERLSPWDSSLVTVDTPTTAWLPGLTPLDTGTREKEVLEEEEEGEEVGEDEEEEDEDEEEGDAEEVREVSRSALGWKTQRRR